MKIIGICGSARKGNTEQMIDWVLDSCKAEGAGIKLIRLSELDIKQCTGCDICLDEDIDCSIDDDMKDLLPKLINADAIILGTPNYFTNVSGGMKTFMDRTHPLYEPLRLKGKLAGIICVGARPAEETKAVAEAIEEYLRIMELEIVGSVVAKAEDIGDVSSQEDIKKACTELGKNIIEQLKK